MDPDNSPNNSLSGLQFTTNETASPPASTGGLTCVGCKRPIDATYFALADQVICPACRDQVTAKPTGNGLVRFFKAAALGIVAGLLGALLWYLIRVIAHVEIGLIAILVGFMVGKAIHMATGGRGGLKYQLLAVVVTYSCIAANYVPDIVQALITASREDAVAGADADAGLGADAAQPAAQKDADAAKPADVEPAAPEPMDAGADSKEKLTGAEMLLGFVLIGILTIALALATPIVSGMESPIGLLIVGFALWEAWKFSGHKPPPITGPYHVGQPGPPIAPTAG